MNHPFFRIARLALVLMATVGMVGPIASADTCRIDAQAIQKATSLKGTLSADNKVFKVTYPRKDLHVVIAGVKATPAMGLTAWAAFQCVGNAATVMGDLVMTENQVDPVMSSALDQGLQVTALHNHFFYDTPKVMFMHIGGTGDISKLASSIGEVFKTLKETAKAKRGLLIRGIDPNQTSLNPKKIDAILGTSGKMNGGVYKVVFGRTTRMGGHEFGKAMGVNTWATFIGKDPHAVVDGDFAMHEDELQGVLKSLRHAGISVVAIHNHMIMETPRILFLHFWGVGSTDALAHGLKAALDTQMK